MNLGQPLDDPELEAMRVCAMYVTSLPPDAHNRVLNWLVSFVQAYRPPMPGPPLAAETSAQNSLNPLPAK
jgi:hypothetical protein